MSIVHGDSNLLKTQTGHDYSVRYDCAILFCKRNVAWIEKLVMLSVKRVISFFYIVLAVFLVLTPSDGFAQSRLKKCSNDQPQRYHNCFGTFTNSDGIKYIGEFRDGKYNGRGTYINGKGIKYIGEWRNGNYHGQGTFTNADGIKYIGEFRNGKYNGRGTYTHGSGNKYVGGWRDNKRDGQAEYIFANGNKYVGEYRDNKRNGQGTYTFADGNKYAGEWRNNKYHGQGTFTFANGTEYVGEWRDSKYNGHGTFYAADGTVKNRGTYQNNILVKAETIEQTVVKLETRPKVKPSTVKGFTGGKRIALVIGNSSYTNISSLANPKNDAALMVTTLKDVGFDVVSAIDADYREMRSAMKKFGRKLRSAGKNSVGLFYFAGHGVQANGTNYLIPLRADISSQSELDQEALNAADILSQMEEAGNRLNLVILDACRNNPFPSTVRSNVQGLARMNAASGALIAFSTAPGQVAKDGVGNNSPYTEALVEAIRQPGLAIEYVFKRTRISVRSNTGNEQTPWEQSSLVGDFYFMQPDPAK